jgi:hypothetical protein
MGATYCPFKFQKQHCQFQIIYPGTTIAHAQRVVETLGKSFFHLSVSKTLLTFVLFASLSILKVRATLICTESNCATVCLLGTNAIRFFKLLQPSHVPPHRIAFMRITELLEKAVFREYHRIVADNALLYGTKFASTNSDFYTKKERRESYGCLVANMMAQQYIFKVSHHLLFSSFQCKSSFVVVSSIVKLPTVSHFVCTLYALCLCVLGWTEGVCQQQVVPRYCQKYGGNGPVGEVRLGDKAGLRGQFIICHSTDGASNAVGLSMEFHAGNDGCNKILLDLSLHMLRPSGKPFSQICIKDGRLCCQ